ncbi:MAG: efflux RND transporter periplasmic adaptor subunit [Marinilabiliales bacterium]|nr:MAG: efflux RND transporter periplasmic adaptor subunit [Marinilabiliales bacterium]
MAASEKTNSRSGRTRHPQSREGISADRWFAGRMPGTGPSPFIRAFQLRQLTGAAVFMFLITMLLQAPSCSSPESATPDSIREEIEDYRRQISEITRNIQLLEQELEQMGEAPRNNRALNVTVSQVERGPFENYIRINGSAEAVNDAMISPEINGQIRRILVSRGDRVNNGQALARLNTSVIEGNIEELKTSMKLARTVYERQRRLWDQQIGSEIQYLEARNNVESMESRLKTLEHQLEMAVLKSPINGVVDEIFLKEGELAMPGAPVMQVINLERLYINTDVSERYLPDIEPNGEVILRFPAWPDYEARVPVHRIGNVINPENRTFRLQLMIDNPDERFKPNMVASVGIRSFSAEDVVTLPSVLIKQDIQGHFVYVARQNGNGTWQAHKNYIARGAESEGRTIIENGLAEGDLVIVRGHNQVTEGIAIAITGSTS